MEVGSSNSSGQQLSGRVVDTRGKHRIHAELNRLQQEARFLEVCLLYWIKSFVLFPMVYESFETFSFLEFGCNRKCVDLIKGVSLRFYEWVKINKHLRFRKGLIDISGF
ncbi:unnamed protein product [Brassica rapa]|uniref:Uncharacterized protein n=1 Tax=Brassica campestris TaxID=3711 RepID=A0A8D9LWH1_BRACM|nr:unnamed protein product [Brassica rapa]